jgi:hypothetical protein
MEQRTSVPEPWLLMVNNTCHRNGFLKDIGDDKLAPSGRVLVGKDYYCSACNPLLLPVISFPPARDAPLCVPRSSTYAHSTFELFEAFAVE